VQVRLFDGYMHETKLEARAGFLKKFPEQERVVTPLEQNGIISQ